MTDRSGTEPIAVIGMACRLPGAPDPDTFWHNLRTGVDAVTPAPPGRYPTGAVPEPLVGGFLDDVDLFDADFFGISPKEAAAMDPRQRLSLELCWEALDDARIRPAALSGSDTGVFVGAIGDDYAALTGTRVDRFAMTGLHRGVIANRVSYAFGLRGPSFTVDSAQSSSLVAVLLAVESLRRGESTVALAGGVQLNLAPAGTLAAAAFGGLSPDGRCFTFDGRANGFVRGEGGGFVVLKPLSRALADGDRIHCLLLGGAVNNDGATDALTVPGRQAQEDVLRAAYDRAGVSHADVQYVELHGTGTAVGDPIEAAALGTVLGAGRADGAPLRVGSVKTNIGHLEGAAGIAGLLKAALSLAHRELPPSLHYERPNPAIALDDLHLDVQRDLGGWPRPADRLVAGVSSFGIGGTNCHLVLAEAPPVAVPSGGVPPVESPAVVWPLSARDPRALADMVSRLRGWVGDRDVAPVGRALALRSEFDHRAVLLDDGTVSGRVSGADGPVFVFPGGGSGWAGMAAGLWESSAVFRESMRECEAALGSPVVGAARGGPGFDRPEVLWAVTVSLARVWESIGVRPAAVVGRADGAIAAATVSGELSMADAARMATEGVPGSSDAFDDAVRALGDRLFIDCGPHPTLTTAVGVVVPTLTRDDGGPEGFWRNAATAWVHGAPVDWTTRYPGGVPVDLPAYPFQRRRHWFDTAETRPAGAGQGIAAVLRDGIARVLGSTADPDPHRTFKDLGFDSLGTLELRDLLSAATGRPLPTGLLYDHPTPAALLAHLENLADLDVPEVVGAPREAPTDDPVVITAMACRYPGGVTSPETLWDVASAGTDVMSDFPTNRGWDLAGLFDDDPGRPGTSYVRRGGFLHDADLFDPAFFDISPREATAMDPQQRLLLEGSWEALERAGIRPATLRGSSVGVFVGATAQDYGPRLHEAAGGFDGYLLTGTTGSVMSGRIAYHFGFEGPAVTVDTACSSSLVAVHLAVRALRDGQCDLALAGGVTVMANPGMFVEFSRQRGLAPDGRCKPFGAGADGTAWSEGMGVVVLERLSDALRHGRRVLAVVRGTAINQDGASNGLTAPNGSAQRRVIARALADADLRPADVDAVEAHGTGTGLGDPIEADALLATYGRDRPAGRPLWLGSVKASIGHTQAAAGIAGVIKMVGAIQRAALPAVAGVTEPTPKVDWSAGGVEVLTADRVWPQVDRPRRAGVSSFGISGTNAHVVIEQAPAAPPAPAHAVPSTAPVVSPLVAWPVSARSEAGVAAAATALGEWVGHRDPADVGLSLALRSGFGYRAVALGADRAELLAGLREPVSGRVLGPAGPVFVFPGQGSQWKGMAAGLWESSPVFRDALSECDAALTPFTGWSVADVARGDGDLDRDDVVQPVLWAMMVSLARVWESVGVAPAAVVGHSQGEIAAATVAGALSVSDAARVVALRSVAIARLAGRGGMASVALPAAEVVEWLDDGLSVAAVNGPVSTVVSGDRDRLEALVARLADAGHRVRVIPVSYASHSAVVAEVRDEVLAALEPVRPTAGRVPLISTVTGAVVDTATMDAAYWYRNLRETVRFDTAVGAAAGAGHRLFVECSPHPLLTVGVTETLDAAGVTGATVPTLTRGDGSPERFWRHAAQAWTHGATVDWSTQHPGGRPVDLPTYPFQRQRYWLTPPTAAAGGTDSGHPVLGNRVDVADDTRVWTGRLSTGRQPWLADHAVMGTVVVPGAALVEAAVRAGREVGCDRLAELTLHAPLVLPEGVEVTVQAVVGPVGGDGHRAVDVYSRADDGSWTRHATGSLDNGPAVAGSAPAWPPAGAEPVDLGDAYARLADRGYDYGPAFQRMRALWRTGDTLFADVDLDPSAAPDPAVFAVHPVLLDAALHPAVLSAGAGTAAGIPLPFAWRGVRVTATAATAVRVTLTLHGTDELSLSATDTTGAPVFDVESLTLRPLRTGGHTLHTVEWPTYPVTTGPAGDAVLFRVGSGATLRQTLGTVLGRVREWLADDRSAESRLVVVTGGGVTVDDRDGAPDPTAAAVWGLVRSAQTENPDRFVLVDLDGDPASEALLPSLVSGAEPQLAVRAGVARVPRLAPLTATGSDPGAATAPRLGAGTVLVTGGTGALGGAVARHLAGTHGVRHLLLVGRGGVAAPDLVQELTDLGATVTVTACDVSDRAAVAGLLASVPAEHPLTAVVHAAGRLDDGLVTTLTDEHVDRVLAAKVDAARHLDELTDGLDLAAFVLFSSVAGVLGTAGQANYAAANAALDALAVNRRARGRAAVSVSWGLWAEPSGMTATMGDADVERMARLGVEPMATDEGLTLFDAALAADRAHLVAARLNLAALRAAAADGPVPAVARALVPAARPRTATGTATDLRTAVRNATDADAFVLDVVRTTAASVLGHPDPAGVDPDRPVMQLGFDSLTAVELRNRLGAASGLKLPTTFAFDHPSLAKMALYLRGKLVEEPAAPDPGAAVRAEFARLAEVIARLSDGERTLARRMAQDLVSTLDTPTGTADLDSASDEELFALLDSEIGADH